MGKKKITMTVEDKIFAAFKDICAKNGMKVSSKVEILMKDFVEQFPKRGKK